MGSGQRRKNREAIVAKALLLGYQIVQDNIDLTKCQLILPDGKVWYAWVLNPRTGKSDGPYTHTFPSHYHAAKKALELSGVFNAEKSRRDMRTDSRKSDRLRERARERSSAKSVAKSTWLG